MPDQYEAHALGLEGPISQSEVADFSTSDHEFDSVTRAILVTADGTFVMHFADDTDDLSLTLTAGTFLPFRISHIRQTGSSGTIIGLW